MLEVREALRDRVTLQVVAMAVPGAHDLLRTALAAGADVAGNCPHLDPDPARALRACLDAAGTAGVPLDLHTDETLDPASTGLGQLADLVLATGFPHPVTASHCVSLGMQPPATVAGVAGRVAAAGIAVVALPQTNLYLQGRDRPTATPRGLSAVRALPAAGVTVAAGGDNLRDPFNAMGRGDPLEAASLLVTAAHVEPEQAYRAISTAARRVGGAPVGPPGADLVVTPGMPADLLAIRAAAIAEAVAAAPAERVVVRGGAVVSRTALRREWFDPSRAEGGPVHP